MADILKILFVLAVIVFLLKKKWNLGLVMMLSSVILALLYMMKPSDYLKALGHASIDKTTVSLIIILTLIRVFENVMRKNGVMQEMINSFRGLVKDRRIVMAAMPALIGMLPSMGGALFSAPMVEEASKGIKASSEKKAFVNYMFRHPWEYISPIYPGLILASAITAYSLRDLIIANLSYAVFMLTGSILWGLKGISSEGAYNKERPRGRKVSFIPIALILVLVIAFRLDLAVSMGAVTVLMYIFFRYSASRIIESFKEGFSWEIALIILGVMTFKAVLGSSGAVSSMSSFFSAEGVPVLPVLFILPFLSGILTGLTVGFVGATFPIIWGLEDAQCLSAISFAFASGYVGVLVSPVHLCLILTREYFGANVSEVYKGIIKTSCLIMSAAFIQYFMLAC